MSFHISETRLVQIWCNQLYPAQNWLDEFRWCSISSSVRRCKSQALSKHPKYYLIAFKYCSQHFVPIWNQKEQRWPPLSHPSPVALFRPPYGTMPVLEPRTPTKVEWSSGKWCPSWLPSQPSACAASTRSLENTNTLLSLCLTSTSASAPSDSHGVMAWSHCSTTLMSTPFLMATRRTTKKA